MGLQVHHRTIKPELLKHKIDNGEKPFLLDVREPEEYGDWRIAGSINIPLRALAEGTFDTKIPKNKEIVTICMHGIRSEKAMRILAELGYGARVMEGGMVAWNSVYDIIRIRRAQQDVNVTQFRRVGKGCISYIISGGKEAVVIDPTMDVDVYLKAAKAEKLQIIAVLDTHAQADHISGGYELAKITGATYFAPDELGNKIKYKVIKEGSSVAFGNAELSVINTPGHTKSSKTYTVGNLAFTGDTLFVESVGRPDLGQDPSSNAELLWETLHGRILKLDDGTRILPTHYSGEIKPNKPIEASIDELKKKLKALSMTKKEFVEWVVNNTAPKPDNFEIIKKLNKGLIKIEDKNELRDLEAGPNRCAVR